MPPGSSFYYSGDERVFSVEIKYSSQLSSIVDGRKGDAQRITLDKKSGAHAVVMEQDGGGRGVLVVDRTALLNWKTDDFAKGAEAAFAKNTHGPLRIRDQKPPCVGFVRLEPGRYEMSYDGEMVLAKTYASALWLRRV